MSPTRIVLHDCGFFLWKCRKVITTRLKPGIRRRRAAPTALPLLAILCRQQARTIRSQINSLREHLYIRTDHSRMWWGSG
jgi:hypothetical protein